MHSYLILFGFTQHGIENIAESPARVTAAKETVRRLGGEVREFYAILGSAAHDTMFIVDAPDDEAIGKMVLAIGAKGNVRTEAHRLFDEHEFGELVRALP